ncbi:MAG: alanine:cation symporter family protein [Ezakiella sp.]|nr:alanine:cation symporter family protein [Ezakiella sp.]MDD7472310.1 alanine/glycine:cation symporter family protein [Bacillota bacterium]MDY3923047.1 alanine/glycine:cation symporter family protein [Ezakiella sp.]
MDTLIRITNFMWDNIITYLLLGIGLLYTIRLGFPQFTKLGTAFSEAFGKVFKKKKPDEAGEVSSFQALATAIAAQVGTGNIGGVASAILAGGPGAVFWMWISGILGMSTIFGEAVLAQTYREEKDGAIYGGPSYYLTNGLKHKKLGKILAVMFSVFIIIALGLVGNMVQSNSISLSLEQIGINPVVTGVALAVIVGLIVIGGIQRISKFAELVVPFMAIIYFGGAIFVLVKFSSNIIPVFKAIFTSAFSAKAVLGGAVGFSVKQAIRLGLQRGLFSNEAGMGSTPHAHAVADVPHPCNQGFVAMAGVIVDTIIICTLTALIVLVTDAQNVAAVEGLKSVAVTQKGFEIAFGRAGEVFLAIALTFFAFTTIVGWYYFGESNVVYLFGKKGLTPYRILVMAAVVAGTIFSADNVWELSDFFNALMVIPNVIGIFALSGVVKKKYEEWKELEKMKKVKR